MKPVWIRHADFKSKTKLQAFMANACLVWKKEQTIGHLWLHETRNETVLEQLQYKPIGKSPCLSLQYLRNIN